MFLVVLQGEKPKYSHIWANNTVECKKDRPKAGTNDDLASNPWLQKWRNDSAAEGFCQKNGVVK